MITFDLFWLLILVAMSANMVVGARWYGPLFGKQWMNELGLSMEDIQNGQTKLPYLIAILNSFFMAFVLANVIIWTGVSGVGGGVGLALLMWIGFNGFAFATNHAFEDRSVILWFINSGTYLAGLLVMGVILAVWQ
jgi:hypothetical protein